MFLPVQNGANGGAFCKIYTQYPELNLFPHIQTYVQFGLRTDLPNPANHFNTAF
jgi:hypothetical protein